VEGVILGEVLAELGVVLAGDRLVGDANQSAGQRSLVTVEPKAMAAAVLACRPAVSET